MSSSTSSSEAFKPHPIFSGSDFDYASLSALPALDVLSETTGSDGDFAPSSYEPSDETQPTLSSSTAAWEPEGEARKSLESATKPRLELVPWAAVTEIAEVLTFGAKKYDANNWCRGARWGRYFAALCRHVFAWWRGEDKDQETGLSHLAHAGCCLVFLMEYQRNNWGEDDRFKGPDNKTFIKHDS
jgi:Domain of unknown function (DUF5664)